MFWDSLLVQRLSICLPVQKPRVNAWSGKIPHAGAEASGQRQVREDPSCRCRSLGSTPGPGRSLMQENNQACAPAPEPVLQSLGAAASEAHEPRACAPQQEEPLQ